MPNFEEMEGTGQAVRCIAPGTIATTIAQGRVDFARDIRGQVELLRYIRNSRPYVVDEQIATRGLHLIWRLMIATGAAVSIATIGAFMTVIALFDRPLDPNPFLSLVLLLSGLVLVVTVIAIVRGDDR